MKTSIIVILMIFFCAISVQSNSYDKIQSGDTVQKDKIKSNDLRDFQLFWEGFRQAVLDNDTIKLFKLTNFPLKSHGVLDNDPQVKININRFSSFFKICLNEQTGLSTNSETNFDYIKKTINLTEDKYLAIHDNWCRVSAFEFERINGSWKLVLIYFDTTSYK